MKLNREIKIILLLPIKQLARSRENIKSQE